MSRYFAPITTKELDDKIRAVSGYKTDGISALHEHVEKDLKVQFDLENAFSEPGEFHLDELLGARTLENGLTFHGYQAGGDWESPVFFIVYWDGKRLRGYVPTEGNPWNRTTKQAYGNDDEDVEDAKKWYDDVPEEEGELDGWFDFDPEAIKKDILERILPFSGKPANVVDAARDVKAELLAMCDRAESECAILLTCQVMASTVGSISGFNRDKLKSDIDDIMGPRRKQFVALLKELVRK